MIGAAFGNLSSGKSLILVQILLSEAMKGRTIFTNIKLNFPPGCKVTQYNLESLPDMVKQNPAQFRDSVLFLDEAPNIVEGRRATSTLNVDFTMFVTQLGKLGCDLWYTAQIMTSQIDLRLRELGDLYLFCMRYYWHPIARRWMPAAMMPRKIRLGYFFGRREEGPYVPILIYYKGFLKLLGGLQIREFTRTFRPTARDYGLYDTEEIVMLDRSQFTASGQMSSRYFSR